MVFLKSFIVFFLSIGRGEYEKNCKLKGDEKQKNMKGMQGGNGWGREGEERAAAWSAIRLWYLEWLTSAFLISRSVYVFVLRSCSTVACCLFLCSNCECI